MREHAMRGVEQRARERTLRRRQARVKQRLPLVLSQLARADQPREPLRAQEQWANRVRACSRGREEGERVRAETHRLGET